MRSRTPGRGSVARPDPDLVAGARRARADGGPGGCRAPRAGTRDTPGTAVAPDRRVAQQPGREVEREGRLADPSGTAQQDGVGRPRRDHRAHGGDRRRLAAGQHPGHGTTGRGSGLASRPSGAALAPVGRVGVAPVPPSALGASRSTPRRPSRVAALRRALPAPCGVGPRPRSAPHRRPPPSCASTSGASAPPPRRRVRRRRPRSRSAPSSASFRVAVRRFGGGLGGRRAGRAAVRPRPAPAPRCGGPALRGAVAADRLERRSVIVSVSPAASAASIRAAGVAGGPSATARAGRAACSSSSGGTSLHGSPERGAPPIGRSCGPAGRAAAASHRRRVGRDRDRRHDHRRAGRAARAGRRPARSGHSRPDSG